MHFCADIILKDIEYIDVFKHVYCIFIISKSLSFVLKIFARLTLANFYFEPLTRWHKH